VDASAKILWEDIDQLLWYKEWVKLGVAENIAYISPHPYNGHQDAPLPEEQFILAHNQFPEFREFCRQYQLFWKVWAGEVGFSSFQRNETTPTHYYSSNTETQQAEKLVRMMVLQLYEGMEKIFWYDFQNDGWESNNPEHNFGLVLRNDQPKPALVAYANLIHHLRGVQWLGRYAIGGGCDALAFISPKNSQPTLVAWIRRGTRTEKLPVKSEVPGVTVTDIYSKSRRVVVKLHILELELSESPVYVEGLKEKDIMPYLTPHASFDNN